MKKIVLTLLVFAMISTGIVFAEATVGGYDRLTTTFTDEGSTYVNRLRLNFSLTEDNFGAFARLRFQSDTNVYTYDSIVKYAYAWVDFADDMLKLTVGKVGDDSTYEIGSGLGDVLGNISSYNDMLDGNQVIKLDIKPADMLSVTGVYFPGDDYNAGNIAAAVALDTAGMGTVIASYRGAEDSENTYVSGGYNFTGVEGLTVYAGYEYGKTAEEGDVDAVVTYSFDALTAQVATIYNVEGSTAYVEGALQYDMNSATIIALAGYDQDVATANISDDDEYMVGLEGYYTVGNVTLMGCVYYYDETGVVVPVRVSVSF